MYRSITETSLGIAFRFYFLPIYAGLDCSMRLGFCEKHFLTGVRSYTSDRLCSGYWQLEPFTLPDCSGFLHSGSCRLLLDSTPFSVFARSPSMSAYQWLEKVPFYHIRQLRDLDQSKPIARMFDLFPLR